MKLLRTYRLSLVAAAVTLALFFVVQGTLYAVEKPQDYPTRPVTIIVPYGAGGGSDQLTRAFAMPFEKLIGVPVTVVNKPGGGGVAGLSDFFAAPPDGYTLVEHIDDAPTLYAAGRIKENPSEDWFPLVICQITFNQLYVRPDDKRFATWDDFLNYAKKNPEKVTVANVAHKGSMERIVMYQLMETLGFKVTQISFDKPTERYGALVGGHVDVLFEQPGDVRRYIEANQMKPILTMLNERPAAFSDAPCYKDIGVDLKPLYRFRGFFIRKGVKEDRVKWLEEVCKKAFNSDSFQKFNRSKYMHLIDSYRDVEGGKKLVRDTIETYKAMYKKLGIIK